LDITTNLAEPERGATAVAKEWLAQLGTKPGPEVWRRGVQEDERLGIFFNLVIKEERQILDQTL
ncbi:hypothetical protein KUCAC02_014933, partial [Chaenocephalus aceratus]